MLDFYKIRVNNESESKEAQELLFELGYYWAFANIGKNFHYEEKDIFLFANSGGIIATGMLKDIDYFNNSEAKEITLPQLRDLVTKSKKEQGLISGVEAFNANMNGERVLWRYKENDWQEWTDLTAWSKSALTDSNYSFKLKPNTVKIEIEIPAPFEPEDDDEVYFIDCDTKRGYSSDVIGQGCDPDWIQFGAWKSEDEIKQVVAALRSALTSK